MASIRKSIRLTADADTAWAAVSDFANPHHLFAGVLTDARLETDDIRVVTFANGVVVREQIVDLDDAARRLAYTVLDERFSHHHATLSVAVESDGASKLTWISDLLPDDQATMVEGLMDAGVLAAQRVLGREILPT